MELLACGLDSDSNTSTDSPPSAEALQQGICTDPPCTPTKPPKPPQPVVTVLTNGQTVSALSGNTGTALNYRIDVPAGADKVAFVLTGEPGSRVWFPS